VQGGETRFSSADMAAYMRDYRARAGGNSALLKKRQLKLLLKGRPVASHRPLQLPDQREGHCVFCGHRTVAVDDVCSLCRREIEG
jgi:hypothetical protein